MIGKIGPLATKSLVICGDPMTYTDETGRVARVCAPYDKKTGEKKAPSSCRRNSRVRP